MNAAQTAWKSRCQAKVRAHHGWRIAIAPIQLRAGRAGDGATIDVDIGDSRLLLLNPAARTNMDLACRIQASAYAAASIIRDAFSPIMMEGALVLPEVSVGMMEASATRSP
jgi:hypothetical protein